MAVRPIIARKPKVVAPTALDPSRDLVIVYNRLDPDSVALMQYAKARRPGYANALTLGLDIPLSHMDARRETLDGETYPTDLDTLILAPMSVLLAATRVSRVWWCKGLPTRVYSTTDPRRNIFASGGSLHTISVTWALATCLAPTAEDDLTRYSRENLIQADLTAARPFSRTAFPGTACLVAHLTGGTFDDAAALVDRVSAAYTGNLIISGAAAGRGNANIYLDDVRDVSYATYAVHEIAPGNIYANGLVSQDPAVVGTQVATPYGTLTVQQANVYQNTVNDAAGDLTGEIVTPADYSSNLLSLENPLAYFSWGQHGTFYMAENYVHRKVAIATPHPWFFMGTNESYNGIQATTGQSTYRHWFGPEAFGGAGYSHCPFAAVAHCDEPGPGVGSAFTYLLLFLRQGRTVAEAFHLANYFSWDQGGDNGNWSRMLIADPLTAI